ncbi:cytochrome c biogenesis protein CcsB [Vibrio nigripulchritudo]|uniref:c-type cytochrome n=1 Tax=Vibrio nigripulchritudo TaxID=28173 RepID=UPI00190A89D8|nr:c-type cytochrome [Vibrio nigripulchritudo]BCL68987.1 cytochrome c biogenesis protein CcsB [Vibrio nigripulchritudo]BDU30318.1 cytochrome c biogenesis protein CcsB [Vibrio nigripulchritudo]
MKNVAIGCVLSAAILSGGAYAAGDVNAGKAKAAVCAACHGADGIALIDGYPNLKGQNEKYIVTSLKAYKANQRTGGLAAVMSAQAMALSEQDMENLAAYYSSLK